MSATVLPVAVRALMAKKLHWTQEPCTCGHPRTTHTRDYYHRPYVPGKHTGRCIKKIGLRSLPVGNSWVRMVDDYCQCMQFQLDNLAYCEKLERGSK